MYIHTHIFSPQDGQQLQQETSLEELWGSGMQAYGENDWQTVVDRLEKAILVFNSYQNNTLLCLQQCSEKCEKPSLSISVSCVYICWRWGRKDHIGVCFVRRLFIYSLSSAL